MHSKSSSKNPPNLQRMSFEPAPSFSRSSNSSSSRTSQNPRRFSPTPGYESPSLSSRESPNPRRKPSITFEPVSNFQPHNSPSRESPKPFRHTPSMTFEPVPAFQPPNSSSSSRGPPKPTKKTVAKTEGVMMKDFVQDLSDPTVLNLKEVRGATR